MPEGGRPNFQHKGDTMGIDLALIWAIIILFGVMMYVVMDGFDLGIGVLYLFVPDKENRDVMMNTVAPVWDGNETWLVLGGAGLLAAFPLAYSVILSAFMLPLIFMLLGLIFRGVAFEFRFKATPGRRHLWDKAFIAGSLIATFFQGVTLGAYIDGIPLQNGAYAGGVLDWLRPFPIFTGLGLIVAYALLGCTWLVMKTEGELQRRMLRLASPLTLVLLAVIVLLSVWTPLAHTHIAERWFSRPNIFWFAPVPVLVALTAFALIRSLRREPHAGPFLLTLGLVFLGYSGLGISVWPNIIPPSVSIWEASGPPQSQGFALVGALLIIPVILMYTAWSYYVFRGKVRSGEGYH
jgi:cytochrome d ubiquinol oxidase subunit II